MHVIMILGDREGQVEIRFPKSNVIGSHMLNQAARQKAKLYLRVKDRAGILSFSIAWCRDVLCAVRNLAK